MRPAPQPLLAALFLAGARAHSAFIALIPNGDRVPNPNGAGERWVAVGHVYPQPPRADKGADFVSFSRNPFGHDFAAAGFKWTRALCMLDSDGDGRSNGDELGDPHCVWHPGADPTRTSNISHPGMVHVKAKHHKGQRQSPARQIEAGWVAKRHGGAALSTCNTEPWPIPFTDDDAARKAVGYSGVCYGSVFCESAKIRIWGVPMCAEVLFTNVFFPVTAILGIALYFRFRWLPQARWLFHWGSIYLGEMGIAVAAHRYFSHQIFTAGAPGKLFLALNAVATMHGDAFLWAFMHRIHHKYCEQELDFHSPEHPHHPGFGFAHSAWTWTERKIVDTKYVKHEIVKDLFDGPDGRLIGMFKSEHIVLLYLAIAVALTCSWYRNSPQLKTRLSRVPIVFFYYWGMYIALPLVASWHATMAVNSATHIWGNMPFRDGMSDPSQCHARNTPWLFILLWGENWHNNHHAVPSSASTWVRWYQFDLPYVMMRVLELTGLIWDVRVDKPSDYDPNVTGDEEFSEVCWMVVQLVGLAAFLRYYLSLPSRRPPTDDYDYADILHDEDFASKLIKRVP